MAARAFDRVRHLTNHLCAHERVKENETKIVECVGNELQYTPIHEIQNLFESAKAAFQTGCTRSITWRLAQMNAVKKLLEENTEELSEALYNDSGSSRFHLMAFEVTPTLTEIREISNNLEDWVQPEAASVPPLVWPDGAAFRVHEPKGVVTIIAPWNFPISLVLIPLVGAIAAGNCCIIKPSEVSVHVSALLSRLLPQYLDSNCIKVIQGGPDETTELLKCPVDHIFYTGNGHVARIIMSAAAKHLIPVTLELGGKSPVIVDRDANIELTAKRIIWAKTLNCGQVCVTADYVLVHEDIHEDLLKKLQESIIEYFGNDVKSSADFGRIITQRHTRRILSLLDQDESIRGKIVCGGRFDVENRFIEPTILRDVSSEARIMQEEIFGPILPILKVKNVDEAIAFVNARPKPLALYVFTSNHETADRVLNSTSSGGACVNEVIVQLTVLTVPFGGVGESGMGNYHGKYSFDTFSHLKTVLRRSHRSMFDLPLRYPPFHKTDGSPNLKQRIMEKSFPLVL